MKTFLACIICIVVGFLGLQYGLHGDLSQFMNPRELLGKRNADEKPKTKYPDDLLPNTKGLAVPWAAKWNRTGEHPGIVVLTREGTIHPWHEKLYPGWKSETVEHTELVLIVDTIKQKPASKNANGEKGDTDKKTPPQLVQLYWRDVWLVESSTGTQVASKRFRADREGENIPNENAAEAVIPWELVFDWMRSQLQEQAQPESLSAAAQ